MIALLQAVLAAANDKTQTANPLVSLLPILLIGVVFYFLLIRPQQRRSRAQRELTQSIDEGDEVITLGGLFGVVRELDDDSVLLEVAPGIDLRFLRSAIGRKLTPEDEVAGEGVGAGAGEDDSEYVEPDEEFGKDSEPGEKK
jgi:preprotein translocase subunit YajC